ncbi:hypothetical protein MYX06_04315 [Patescibacteria group bacterium AH-259-L05]|nr:hypothetical protein [Patescibacteria group bacterium AH-259-L05]
MENKLKHLEFIQATIGRMATNSFIVKGWSITLVAILFTLSSTKINNGYIVVSFIPVLMFWILDGFFISRERSFRSLYNHVRKLKVDEVDFLMDVSDFRKGRNNWFRSIFSGTVTIFYISLIISMLIIYYLIK